STRGTEFPGTPFTTVPDSGSPSFFDNSLAAFTPIYYKVTTISSVALESTTASPEAGAVPQGTFSFTPPPLRPQWFGYALNQADSPISILTLDTVGGQIRHNGFLNTLSGASHLVASTDGTTVYAANGSQVSAYRVNGTTGGLTLLSTVSNSVAGTGLTIDP